MTDVRKSNKKNTLKKQANKFTLAMTKDTLSYSTKNGTTKKSFACADPSLKDSIDTENLTTSITLNQPSFCRTNVTNLEIPTTDAGKKSSPTDSDNDDAIIQDNYTPSKQSLATTCQVVEILEPSKRHKH